MTVTSRWRRSVLPRRGLSRHLVAVLGFALVSAHVEATSVRKVNLVDLIAHSDTIVAGRVERVSDGFDSRGLPYTEITLHVGERIRGNAIGKTYTFRQFGLLAPRRHPSGKVSLAVAPDGWPRFAIGQQLALFLGSPARRTGLRSTVGLRQGTLVIERGKVKRSQFNAGLFDRVAFTSGTLSAAQSDLVKSARANQGIDAGLLLGLVRQAVTQNWVGKGAMTHAR